VTAFVVNIAIVRSQHAVFLKHRVLTFQFEMKMLFVTVSQITEDENLLRSLRAKNENLESKLSSLRQKIEEQDKLNGSCIEAEMSALRTEKKRLEEELARIRNEQWQKADDSSVNVVKELKAQKVQLEEKLASVSAELERNQHSVSSDADAELTALRNEKHRLDVLVTYLEKEVQQHKDAAHEQRIRALDLKHELREVWFMLLCCYRCFSDVTTCFC